MGLNIILGQRKGVWGFWVGEASYEKVPKKSMVKPELLSKVYSIDLSLCLLY